MQVRSTSSFLGYTDTLISTFHAFGDRVIREHALELGLPSDRACCRA